MLRHATESLEDRVFSELDSTPLSEYAYLDYGPLLLGIELRRRLASASLHRLRAIVRAASQRSERSIYPRSTAARAQTGQWKRVDASRRCGLAWGKKATETRYCSIGHHRPCCATWPSLIG